MQPGTEISFDKTVNFRELGGYRSADGRTVRWGQLYRCGNLDVLKKSPSDWKKLCGLGIRSVLDLRSAGEAALHPDPALPGAESVRLCAMLHDDGSEMDFSPAGISRLDEEKSRYDAQQGRVTSDFEWFSMIYCRMPFGNPAYHRMFELLQAHQTPLLFHCSAGKDRTGIAAMLILLALGINDQTALDDYMLTNVYRRAVIEASLEGLSEQEKEMQLSVEGVNRKMGAGTLQAILQRHGSYDAYFEAEYGLNAVRLAALRDYYLEDVDSF